MLSCGRVHRIVLLCSGLSVRAFSVEDLTVCVKPVIFMVLKLEFVVEHKRVREETENTRSGFLDDNNEVKQKSECEPGYLSKEPGTC